MPKRKCEYTCTKRQNVHSSITVKASYEINPRSINSETDKIKCCHLHAIETKFSNDKKLLLNATWT